ncbi:hypothetical protein PsorP6_016111 [Peronosclerospora sorghi]|uniref:Uncharacterized protein n=1 Tax=Peronosclerospora sorghi TaxID=230839 RepID=A0ACC0VM24_9STRA|nr:hypothetical protein PsorP6_016111 [Peronosclerospora sorghi]
MERYARRDNTNRLPMPQRSSLSSNSSEFWEQGDNVKNNVDDVSHFPLPDNYFPPVHLTNQEIQDYEAQLQEIIKNALVEYEEHEARALHNVYQAPWSLVSKVKSLTAIKRDMPGSSTPTLARIFGRINGKYRDMMEFFYAETSADLFAWNQFMFGYAVDAAVLKNIYTMTSKKECLYMGIKWTCLSPMQLMKKRDNCYMEYLIYTKDLRGCDVGIRVTLPLDIPECMQLPKRLKTKRIQLKTVWIFRPADHDANTTEFFMLSENQLNGLVITSSYYKRMMNILMNMAIFVDSRRILKQGVMTQKRQTKSISRKNCSVCSRKFGPTRRRHFCRLCGDLICRRCIIVRRTAKDDEADTMSESNKCFEIVKSKFCLLCVTKLRETHSDMLSVAEFLNEDLSEFCNSVASKTGSESSYVSSFSETGTSDDTSFSPPLASLLTSSASKVPSVSELDATNDRSAIFRADSSTITSGIDEDEVTETIDTMDMMPLSALNSKQSGNPSKLKMYNHSTMSPHLGRSSQASPRSLDQCLAEQEELLRRVMLSASGTRQNAM